MTEVYNQSEFTILFQSLLNIKRVYLCNLQLFEMKLNGPESHWFFARLQILAPSCSIQRLLKLLINSPVFRRCPPKCHTGWVLNLCTRTAKVVPTSCDPHLLQKQGWLNSLKINSWTARLQQDAFMKTTNSFILPIFMYWSASCYGSGGVHKQLGSPSNFCNTGRTKHLSWISFIWYQVFYFPENQELFLAGFSRYFYSRIPVSCLISANAC